MSDPPPVRLPTAENATGNETRPVNRGDQAERASGLKNQGDQSSWICTFPLVLVLQYFLPCLSINQFPTSNRFDHNDNPVDGAWIYRFLTPSPRFESIPTATGMIGGGSRVGPFRFVLPSFVLP